MGGGRVSLGRLREGTWQFEELATGTYTTKGHIAASGARVGATFLDVDPFAMRISVRYIEPGGGVETIAEGCGPKPHALAIGARGPIIALACHDRLQLFERTTAGWREAYDERPDQHPWIRRLAVDGSGDRHLLVSYRMVAHHISIRDGVKRAHELPENMELADLAVCGGRVHGSFYRRSLDEPVIAFGTFADGRWMLEEVERGEGGSWDLGFDDACRPFLAGGTIVWSRGNGEWTSSEVTRRHADIKAVVGIDGVLYAAYEYEDDNGVRVGIATAPLVDPTAAPSE